jgi:hypothetical protein
VNDSILKRVYGLVDARSRQGIYSRGKNVYRGGSAQAHKGGGKQFGRPKKSAIARRIGLK